MDGVITAIVAFLLACLVWPHLVKNKPQYYAAYGCVVLIILLQTLILMFSSTASASGFRVFCGTAIGFLTVIALLLCMLFAGGLTVKDLTGEIKGTYEVIRRGQEEKEIIIPQRGGVTKDDADKPPVYVIDPETGNDKQV